MSCSFIAVRSKETAPIRCVKESVSLLRPEEIRSLKACLDFSQVEEDAPPRPPLPHLYSPDDHPPAVPPLPKETSVIRHTSVRGLKRQSDERKRDREIGQYSNGDKMELRTFLSEPELLGVTGQTSGLGQDGGYQTLPSRGNADVLCRWHGDEQEFGI